MNYIKVYRVT